ncbi:hypothetical protein [Rhizobium sp. ZPR3]|uniref:Uncharacterized protein n=1 Tax=Rhizobium sp. ZPR3 TaxID=3158967 RepID=A0AAU7S0V0_9HYPH
MKSSLKIVDWLASGSSLCRSGTIMLVKNAQSEEARAAAKNIPPVLDDIEHIPSAHEQPP